MIATDMQPFSVVNDEGFVALVHELDPSYTLPSAKVLTQTVMPAAYAKAKESLTAKLADAEMVSLTTDGWTSRTTESYCATTVHFLNNEWKLCSYLLDCSYMGERHTAINLGEQINKVCTDWDIQHKVVAVTTDNAANIVSAVINYTKYMHLPCFAHTINLIVQQGIRQITPLKTKVKAIVTYFHTSAIATQQLKQYQQKLGHPELKLINDVVTIWNSTHAMLQRICNQQECVEAAMGVLHPDLESLTKDDWATLKEATQLLKPFLSITEELSAEKSVTISKLFPWPEASAELSMRHMTQL